MALARRIDRLLGALVLRPLAVAFALAAIFPIWSGAAQLRLAWEARGWPTATGRIEASSLSAGAAARVEYSYHVGEQRFAGALVHVGQYSGIGRHAADLVRRYPAGRDVVVYYRPADPRVAVLEHRVPWTALLLLAGGGAFAAFARFLWTTRSGLSDMLAQG